MGLNKGANGLPRFMMDCGWWRNGRRWRKPTLAEIGLHHAAISFSNEHGTDGVVPGPADDLAVALSLPVREVTRTVPLLVERGAWRKREDEDYEVVGFLEHNPSRADVRAERKRKTDKALRANHQRWHVDKKEVDADCPLCVPKGIPNGSHKESSGDATGNRARTPNGWMDGWMDGYLSSDDASADPSDAPDENDEPTKMVQLLGDALHAALIANGSKVNVPQCQAAVGDILEWASEDAVRVQLTKLAGVPKRALSPNYFRSMVANMLRDAGQPVPETVP